MRSLWVCLELGVPAEFFEGWSDGGGGASLLAWGDVLVLAGFVDSVAGLCAADAEFGGQLPVGQTVGP